MSSASSASKIVATPPTHEEVIFKLGSPTLSPTLMSNSISPEEDDIGGAILGRRPSSSFKSTTKPKIITTTDKLSSDEEELPLSSPTHGLPLSAISEASDGNLSGSDSEDEAFDKTGNGNNRSGSISGTPRVVERLRLSREHTRISDNVAVKSGYLMKKGERRKAWKKRWFVLRGGQVAMYKNDKEYRLLRLIPLSEIHNCAPIELKKHSFTFGIVTPDRTTYVKASSDREVQEWCSAVERAKEEVKASLTITSIETPTETPESSTPIGPLTPSAAIPIPISMAPVGSNLGNSITESYNTGTSPSPPTPFSYTANSMMSSSFTSTSTAPHDPHASGSRVPPNSFALGPSSALGLRSSEGNTLELGGVDAGLSRIVERQHREQQMSASGGESSGGEFGPTSRGAGALIGGNRRGEGLQIIGSPDYFANRSPSANSNLALPPPSPGGLISSSEDEDGFDANESWMPVIQQNRPVELDRIQIVGGNLTVGDSSTLDPSKVIMSGYLMKQGKRRNWRKRWFVLMSGSLSYQRSHMDGKIHQQIPLSEILDAIEYTPAPNQPSKRPQSSSGPLSPMSPSSMQLIDDGKKNYEHCFKIITPKRTYLVCAPSEEDEIKWLAALQCLVARKVVGGTSMSATGSSNGKKKVTGGVEMIASTSSTSKDRSDPNRLGVESNDSTPIHGRNRSITDAARAAVRDVESRFHSIERLGRT